MNKLMQTLRWLRRIWPLLAMAALVVLHWVIWHYFGARWTNLNKATGAIFQTVGGAVVLFSINDNLGTFRQHGWLMVLKKFWGDRPWKKLEARQGVMLWAECSDQMNATATSALAPTTLEERLQEVERQLLACVALVHTTQNVTNVRIDGLRAELITTIQGQSTRLDQLSSRVEKTLVDAVHTQVFGVFLAVYGTAVGYYA